MKKTILTICLFVLSCMCARTQTIILHTGARITGEIIFENEEVIIVRDESGTRFQYPRSEVLQVVASDSVQTDEPQIVETELKAEDKKATVLFELSGGIACIPNDVMGGAFGIDMLVGSHKIGEKPIFVGAGVGYHGLIIAGQQYNFLPIQAALRLPLMDEKHAPVIGLALGYGVALSKDYMGGIYTGIDVGYRYRINDKTAMTLTLFATFQQAQVKVTQSIEDNLFTANMGRSLVVSGLKMAIYL